eukprot:TRINITY_DN173_c0_g1_i4.p1 TRINITY_DN173_c0_g1~~TRINITY_DN173_c0_g1_i4.p1  ORF type:complete len:151 (-),score=38.93 TRINITY_DN173_c0_g1_i4:203-655(-)
MARQGAARVVLCLAIVACAVHLLRLQASDAFLSTPQSSQSRRAALLAGAGPAAAAAAAAFNIVDPAFAEEAAKEAAKPAKPAGVECQEACYKACGAYVNPSLSWCGTVCQGATCPANVASAKVAYKDYDKVYGDSIQLTTGKTIRGEFMR